MCHCDKFGYAWATAVNLVMHYGPNHGMKPCSKNLRQFLQFTNVKPSLFNRCNICFFWYVIQLFKCCRIYWFTLACPYRVESVAWWVMSQYSGLFSPPLILLELLMTAVSILLCLCLSLVLPIPCCLSPTVPHFKHMPSYDDITHSPIQYHLIRSCISSF